MDLENIKAFLDVLKRDRETTNKKCLLKILFLSIMLDRTGNVKFEYNLSGEIICDINEKKNHYGWLICTPKVGQTFGGAYFYVKRKEV